MRSPGNVRACWRAGTRMIGVLALGAVSALALASGLARASMTARASRPQITHVSVLVGGHEAPAAGPTSGGSEVVISGTNLLSGAQSCLFSQQVSGTPSAPGCSDVLVYFGDEPGLVAYASTHEIAVVSPPHAAGVVDVTVTTPAGTSRKRSADRYRYIGPAPGTATALTPKVTAVAPNEGPPTGFTTVTISGEDLLPSGASACVECVRVIARFGASAVPVLEGTPERLLVVSPPHEPGPVDVSVTVEGRRSATSAADRFAYAGHSRGHGHHRRHHPSHRRHRP